MDTKKSGKFYKGQRLPLTEALMLACPVSRRSPTVRALAKPVKEVRVVPPPPTEPKLKVPVQSKRTKSSDRVDNIRVLREEVPGMGVPVVRGPRKERKSKAAPQQPNSNAAPQQPKAKKKKKRKTPFLHEVQPRSDGWIKFVQGGLPFLGRR